MDRVLIEKSHIPTNPWREALLAMAILAMVILVARTKNLSKRGHGAGEGAFRGWCLGEKQRERGSGGGRR